MTILLAPIYFPSKSSEPVNNAKAKNNRVKEKVDNVREDDDFTGVGVGTLLAVTVAGDAPVTPYEDSDEARAMAVVLLESADINDVEVILGLLVVTV